MKSDFLIETDEKCLHEQACEIFLHSELKWLSYGLPNIRIGQAFILRLCSMIHRRDIFFEHALKRSCVVHCQKPATLIEIWLQLVCCVALWQYLRYQKG